MHFFGRHTADHTGTRHTRHHLFRKDKDRVAGGYKAALSNPNTTREGRKHAKRELKHMGRGSEAHVSFMTKIRRTLGMRSTPRRTRNATTATAARAHRW